MIDEQESDDAALAAGAMTEAEYLRRKVMRLEAALRYHRAWPMPEPFATGK